MVLKKLKCEKSQKLSKLISDELGLGFNVIQKIIRNKDVKVDGKRVSKDIDVSIGALVEIFYNDKPVKIVFENEDLLVAFKPRNIETVSEESNDDLLNKLMTGLSKELFAVHRLDRNTEGLVVFAKNKKAKDCLDEAIKNRKLEKFYLAKVVGVLKNKQEKLVAYLKKDEKKSQVFVSDNIQSGYEKIKTNYKVLSETSDFSILEVELVTGKTHQIRAHMAHFGHPILGDEKYGNSDVNKLYKKKFQCLCAYKLIFHFDEKDYLFYMNGTHVELSQNKIDFLKN